MREILIIAIITVCSASSIVYIHLKYKSKLFLLQSKFVEKLENVLNSKSHEVLNAYQNGFSDGIRTKQLEIRIFPWREEIDHSTFWRTKKSLKVGYQHQLFIDGVPSFQPFITIIEEISFDKLNEQGIRDTFNRID